MLVSYSTCSYVGHNFCNTTEIHILLADKLINIGDISLPGWLDIGTSGFANSRTRCNAEVFGYTGFAELKAATGCDMPLNLSTTRTDGGWMYFKIKNDDYMQLSSSDNKINIYKDTTVSGNLDVGSIGDYQINIHGTGTTTSYAELKVRMVRIVHGTFKTQVTVIYGQVEKLKVLNSWISLLLVIL